MQPITTPRSLINLSVVLLLATGLVGCASGTAHRPPGAEVLSQVGEYVLTYDGPELEAALGYRFAAQSMGSEWLMLEVGLTAPNGKTTHIPRENVFVRTPAGDKITMATQSDFAKAFGPMRADLRRAQIMSDPLAYFPHYKTQCSAGFFADPGENIVYTEMILNEREVCFGRLFFQIPTGIQPGQWVLGIDLKESRIRIPFELIPDEK